MWLFCNIIDNNNEQQQHAKKIQTDEIVASSDLDAWVVSMLSKFAETIHTLSLLDAVSVVSDQILFVFELRKRLHQGLEKQKLQTAMCWDWRTWHHFDPYNGQGFDQSRCCNRILRRPPSSILSGQQRIQVETIFLMWWKVFLNK